MPQKKNLNAIDMLVQQHHEVAALFETIESARANKKDLFATLADKVAMHAAIEETHFYPAVRAKETDEMLDEAVEEHLSVKRVLVDLMEAGVDDSTFDAKLKVLKEQIEHHVEEEEGELFPKAKKLLSEDELIAIAQEMTASQEEMIEGTSPRMTVWSEVGACMAV